MANPTERPIAKQTTPERRPEPVDVSPDAATPVYGNAVPARGLSKPIREAAYSRPTHDPMHWLTLLMADRADTAASVAADLFVPGRQGAFVRHFGRQLRGHPAETVLAVAARLGLLAVPLLLLIRRRRPA